jgi:aldose 1-epimerase
MAERCGPTGTQFAIEGPGGQSALVAEVGATLRSWRVAGEEQLDPFDGSGADEAFRGKVLVPWPNRIRDGHYRFAGVAHRTPITEPDRGCALHGLALWVPWRLVRRSPDRVVLAYVLHPQPGYPFTLGFELEYRLDARGLTITLEATNAGGADAPFGAGFHPYLALGGLLDDVVLEVPGAARIPVDGRLLPVGDAERVEGTEYDFRRARPIGALELDTCFGALERDGDGLARARVATADGARALTVWMDEGFAYVHVYTSDAEADPARRRRAVAIEPTTCAPDAFNSGEGLLTLAPGASFVGRWGLAT